MDKDKRKARLRVAVESIVLHAVGIILMIVGDVSNPRNVLLAAFFILCLLLSVKNYSDLKKEKKEKNNPFLVVVFVLIMTYVFMILFFLLICSLFHIPLGNGRNDEYPTASESLTNALKAFICAVR